MSIKQAIEALEHCIRAHVNTLENGRDRILFLGGDCDDVPTMEAASPSIRQARAALAALRSMPAEPYAYAVYFPDQPTEELVHDLDELLDDMTNRKHTVTELFAASPTAPAQAEPVSAPTAEPDEWAAKIMELAHRWAQATYCKGQGRPFEDFDAIQREMCSLLATPPSAAAQPEAVGEIVGFQRVGFRDVPTIYWAEGFNPAIGFKLYAAAPTPEPMSAPTAEPVAPTISISLLPCPFCGHEHPEFERMGDRRQSCIVICGNCGARHESGDEGSRNGSSWNQRSEPGQDGLRATLETALARIEDMLADDDGQAFKEARKFLESARQLSEQPGFVMVPVEVVKFLTGEGPLDGLWFGEHPFGLGGGKYWWRKHLFAARPLTASPTAPSTEASEPVRDEPKSLNAKIADQLRPFLKPGDKVIWREAFRWHDDNGVLSNHYDSMSVSNLADDFGYEFDWDLNMNHAAIVRASKGTPL